MKEIFESGWKLDGAPGICGGGSLEVNAVRASNAIINIIEGLKKTHLYKGTVYPLKVNDAGCGDLEWARFIYAYLHNAIDYKGYDLIPRENRFNFKVEGLDITKDRMRDCDVIISRLVFIHLSNENINNALHMFKRTGAKFLIATDFPEADNDNRHKRGASKKGIKHSLADEPFNLPCIRRVKEVSLFLLQ